MGKEKKFRNKIVDAAAGVINWHDRVQTRVDRLALIVQYMIASYIHRTRKNLAGKKKSVLGHFAGAILVAVAVVALFNHATGFEYSYNGKALGYVKNQEDVIKILDLVSDELSKEYGSKNTD